MRVWIAIAACALASGCGLVPERAGSCDKAQPYHEARESPPLKAPAGADAPDTRNALRIPEVKAPQLPIEPGRCLDHPPSYGAAQPKSG
ncbi:MAG: hypothetical protein WD929_01260 [Steroidobacteraceae bacterium]